MKISLTNTKHMTIKDIILNIETMNEEAVVYAKTISGEFTRQSEAILLELTEDELALKTTEIAKVKCPGFDYFLEAFMIKEMVEDLNNLTPKWDIGKITDRIIHYAKYDA